MHRRMRSCLVNWEQFKGDWKVARGKLKEQWGRLTDDDLDQIEGRREQLLGRIQQRYGMGREEAERAVDSWLDRVNI
jgi:uncharacterized protein YjbJ (UPF0337 family)